MKRRAICALVLLWSISAWAKEPSRPNLSGTWTLVRSLSRFETGPMPGVTFLRIEPRNGGFRLLWTTAEQSRSVSYEVKVTTDGKEAIRKDAGHVSFERGSWDGNRLAVVTRTEYEWGESTATSTYSLSPDGNTLTVEDRIAGRFNIAETLVFHRSGEAPIFPRMTLKPLGYGRGDGRYPADERILLQLAFTNDQQVPVELRLRDHGKEGGQEPLWSLAARITDEKGRVLTRSCCPEEENDDWWSSAIASSDSCGRGECVMPGDYVTLAPGETVLRTAELRDLLWNCPGLVEMRRSTLPAGTYDVQLTVDGVVSEPLRIVIE